MHTQIHNRKPLKLFRKQLRNHLTPAEAKLWTHISRSQLGQKFRRQHSVGSFILDFYCPESRLAVELDGDYHFTEEGIEYDNRRTKHLNTLNIRVIRFENQDVFNKLPDVLEILRRNLNT